MALPLLEPLLCCEQDLLQLHAGALAQGAVALYTAKSPLRTDASEDACAAIPLDSQRAVLAVADGVGGLPCAAEAARLALTALAHAVVRAVKEHGALREAILEGFDGANRAVTALGVGAATTLAVAEIRGRVARSYHVGDSGVLVTGARGKLKLQTLSHSPVGYAVESGLLDARAAMQHEDRHLISNMVGSASMRVEMGPLLELAPRDTLLIASDGLLDNLHLHEIVERMRKGTLDEAAQALAEACQRRMLQATDGEPSKPDDVTIVLYRPRPAS
jgi:serine/threonine protein phosphatase PrpC